MPLVPNPRWRAVVRRCTSRLTGSVASAGIGWIAVLVSCAPADLRAAASMAEGVDVSEYQGAVDWSAVVGSGRRFAIARVGDGTFLDPTFDRNWQQIAAGGLIRGVYQFFEPSEDPVTQANIVISKVGTLGPGDLPPVLDVEVTGGQSAATIDSNIGTWVTHVRSATGRNPLIYTSPGFWDGSVGGQTFATDLWVAHWNVASPGTLPTGWSNWRLWQYSDVGQVPGITGNVDLDRFNGALTDLEAYAHLIPGDADRDGRVDFADLVILARNYGQKNAVWSSGDFNFDGTVGFDDLVLLARNYGHSVVGPQVANLTPAFRADLEQAFADVPESSNLSLLTLAAAVMLRRRWR